MTNRWEFRTEPEPGQGWLYWHILFRDQPQVAALASIGQERLASVQGLHFTPREWLHITTLVPGLAENFTSSEIDDMIAYARRMLSGCPPIQITLGRVLYHPEAITLGVKPDGALDPLRKVIWQATSAVIGGNKELQHQPWIPHITLAYSTAHQPAGHIIDALGRELPACKAVINSICLVVQEGAECLWNWCILDEVRFGVSSPQRNQGRLDAS
jgi:2'-5' RNA ligase